MVRRSVALALLCICALIAVPAMASADTPEIVEPQGSPPTNFDGWQAGTCLKDVITVETKEVHCGPNTGGLFFKQAGGHPPVGFTQYTIQHEPLAEIPSPPAPAKGLFVAPIKEPEVNKTIKTLRVDLPPGLTVNPNATPTKCNFKTEFLNSPSAGKFAPLCKAETQVGVEEVTAVTNVNNVELEIAKGVKIPVPKGFVVPPTEGLTKVPVYNLTPNEGEPALFGFVVAGEEVVLLKTEVAWQSDFHESFTIELPNSAAVSKPGLTTLISRLINNGNAGNGTYINNPTTCFNPAEAQYEHLYSTWFRAESYGVPNPSFPNGSTPIESKVVETNPVTGASNPVQQVGCENVPFTPGLAVDAGTPGVDSPAPATVETTLKYLTGAESPVQESHLRKAVVALPEGMGLNPSGSVGLGECTDAQFKKGQRTYSNECPANSQIGTVTIESPPLERPLTGNIYVGTQKSSNPESGEEFRLLVEAKEPKEGIDVRLVGNTAANATTGQLTTTFDEKEVGELAGALPEGLPQVPFTSVKLKFGGPNLVLTSPSTCESQATGQMEPWSQPGKSTAVSSTIKLSADPGGGSCPTSLGARKFAPSYTAASESTAAAQYSPFKVHIGRKDGEQEIKAVNVTLPKGLVGRLAGIPYCGEAEIAAAAASSGRAQQAKASCSSESAVGFVTTQAGTGDKPLSLNGVAYLAGPYRGAPISLAIITPAVSGPFDLGTVVVRVALNINPLTAQVNAVSDPIPNVFGGVKLDIRSIDLNMNRYKFTLNPTGCEAGATAGTINGGGSNPASSSSWSSYAVSAAFQATGCTGLGFKPEFHARISGPTTRAKNPQIRVVVKAKPGQANIARTALNLPHSLFLDQGHIKTVCTRVQLAAQQCPQNSIYGHAEAGSPLLKQKLKGPVYLVSSKHKLPDLLADLRGQINIQLDGVISSKHGGLKTVFNNTPDVPIKSFVLNMRGGKKSLLQNSANLCKGPQLAILNMKGQNGKTVKNNKLRLNVASCGGKKKTNKKK
jgi:hypothetical protein